jgi:hypothetical protein
MSGRGVATWEEQRKGHILRQFNITIRGWKRSWWAFEYPSSLKVSMSLCRELRLLTKNGFDFAERHSQIHPCSPLDILETIDILILRSIHFGSMKKKFRHTMRLLVLHVPIVLQLGLSLRCKGISSWQGVSRLVECRH